MESDPSAFKPRGFGQIVGDSFGTYLIEIAEYTAIAAIVIVPLALCSGGLWALGDFARTGADGWSSDTSKWLVTDLLFPVGTFLLSMLACPLMYGALIHATEQKRLGQSISIRQAYLAAFKHVGRLIGAWLVTGILLAVMMASVLCVLFALLLGDRWLLILAAVLAIGLPFAVYFTIKWLLVLQTVMLEESRTIQSLSRSSTLVTGNWWRSLGVCVVLSVAPASVVGIPTSMLLASWENPNGFAAIIIQGIFPALLVAPLSTIAQTLLYFDLRARREQHVSPIMGGGVAIPPAPTPEYAPQVPNVKARQPRRLKLRPALIVIALAVVLVAAITPTILVLRNRADASDIQVFVKSLSTGKEVRLGHDRLKTHDSDIAFIIEFNGSVEAGEQENTIEIAGSDDDWSDGLARVRVYAEQGSAEKYYAPVQYAHNPPEFYTENELNITMEVLDDHHIMVSSVTGSFPAASQIAFILDYNSEDEYGIGYAARLFTR